MRAGTFAAALSIAALVSVSAGAQDEEKTGNDDDVFDNTTLGEKRAQKKAEERREKYQGDSPFAADGKPDKIEKRETRFSPGVQGGYRAGWGFPGGNLVKGVRFTTALTGMIFLWGDGGYRPIPELTLGIYLAGGYVIPDCSGDVSCTMLDFRGGLQAQWRFLPFADFTPWVGLGAGWELFYVAYSNELEEDSAIFHGPEMFMLQGGVDIWAPTARGHAGLFVAYSLGRFISTDSGILSGTSDETDIHNWFYLGVRGTF